MVYVLSYLCNQTIIKVLGGFVENPHSDQWRVMKMVASLIKSVAFYLLIILIVIVAATLWVAGIIVQLFAKVLRRINDKSK